MLCKHSASKACTNHYEKKQVHKPDSKASCTDAHVQTKEVSMHKDQTILKSTGLSGVALHL